MGCGLQPSIYLGECAEKGRQCIDLMFTGVTAQFGQEHSVYSLVLPPRLNSFYQSLVVDFGGKLESPYNSYQAIMLFSYCFENN